MRISGSSALRSLKVLGSSDYCLCACLGLHDKYGISAALLFWKQFCVKGSNLEHLDSKFEPLGSNYKSLSSNFEPLGSAFELSNALCVAFGLLIATDNLADIWQKLRCFKIIYFYSISADCLGSLGMLGSIY